MTDERDECDKCGDGGPTLDEVAEEADQSEEPSDDDSSPWWDATIEELELVAADRRDAGWGVLALSPQATDPELPAAGDQEQFGLAHTLSDDEADQLVALLESMTIDEFETFRRTVDTTCFLVSELRDTDTQRCVLVAGAYDVGAAEELASHATDVGDLFTRFQRLDGSAIASIRHDAYEKLLPPSLTE